MLVGVGNTAECGAVCDRARDQQETRYGTPQREARVGGGLRVVSPGHAVACKVGAGPRPRGLCDTLSGAAAAGMRAMCLYARIGRSAPEQPHGVLAMHHAGH